ncbi:MAG: AAA family ATPase [bacterium]|nr:AAA family ATPase [bacterium]
MEVKLENPDDNIILVGFSGTGKTAVAKSLAERLERRFVDMDGEIEKRMDRITFDIFAVFGEPRFRDEEKKLTRELAKKSRLVIAAGGGTIINKKNLAALDETGTLICLRAAPETIEKRLRNERIRPLIGGDSTEERLHKIKKLKEKRKPHYDAIPIQIHTDDMTPDDIAIEIIKILGIE